MRSCQRLRVLLILASHSHASRLDIRLELDFCDGFDILFSHESPNTLCWHYVFLTLMSKELGLFFLIGAARFSILSISLLLALLSLLKKTPFLFFLKHIPPYKALAASLQENSHLYPQFCRFLVDTTDDI